MKVEWNLGLGDAIICAPIIARLATEHNEVYIPSWHSNIQSVESLFVNYPNVKVRPFCGNPDAYRENWMGNGDLKLGHENKNMPQLPDESFVQWFFRQAGMTEEERWKWCPIQKAAESVEQYEGAYEPFSQMIFVHEDQARGFVTKGTMNKGVWPALNSGRSILAHVKALAECKQIHCIDSSFLHLAEAVETTGKLFYHQYARPNSTDNYKFRKQWTILN